MKKSIIGMVVLTMVTLSSALVGAQDDKLPAPRINTRPVAPPSDATHWTYEGEKGPQFWGKLDPDFSLCAEGQSQSPIDIAKTAPASLPKLRAKFSPANLRIVHHEHLADEINNGHTIQVNYSEGDTMTIGDTKLRAYPVPLPCSERAHRPRQALPDGDAFCPQGSVRRPGGHRRVHRERRTQCGLRAYLFEPSNAKGGGITLRACPGKCGRSPPTQQQELPLRRFADHPALLGGGKVDRDAVAYPTFGSADPLVHVAHRGKQ